MYIRKLVVGLGIAVIISACVPKQTYLTQESALIILKTPKIRYADMGFIYQNNASVKAEIYGNGQAVMALEMSHDRICMSRFECMGQERFNRYVLGVDYPMGVIEDIFRGQAIFGGEELIRKRNGFTQDFKKNGKYAIHYSVLTNEIVFHDTMNAITIKITKQR